MIVARPHERGLSMIEIIIVMLLVAMLMTFGIQSITGARKTGGHALAVTTAHAYEQAIDRFAATHGGRVPIAGTDWATSGTDMQKGPMANVMGTKKHYVRSVPDAIQDGSILLGVGAAPGSTAQSTITYVVDAPGYRLEIRTPGRPVCAMYGQGASAGGGKPDACGHA